MSDILCRWLKRELRLSETVDARNFARDFSNGYLFGEILHKHHMQIDFNMFMKNDSSSAKANNFSRLEPILKQLGIFFNVNIAQDLMQEKQGVAANLLYQLYVALEKKETGTSRTVMQPPVCSKLHRKEHEIHSNHLPRVVKPNVDQNIVKMTQQSGGKGQQLSDSPTQQQKQWEIMGKVYHHTWDALTGEHTKLLTPLPCSLIPSRNKRQEQLREKEAQMVQTEITTFEEKRHKPINFALVSLSRLSDQPPPADSAFGEVRQGAGVPGSKSTYISQSNWTYIQGIRQRLKENAAAQEERQKRVDRFLLEQFKALEAQQEARFEDQLVRRLTRQTQIEQRLAEQLMQIRREKEVILENRLFREQQYQQQRERDFQEALDREAVLAQRAKLGREEEIKKELELYNRIAAERAQARHRKHFAICSEVLGQIVDLATKVEEYRLLTGNLTPEKKKKEWKEWFLRGLPLYEPIKTSQPESGFFTSLNPSELRKQEILNNLDYDEYTNMVGEWAWPEDTEEAKLSPSTNPILEFVIQRLRKMSHPATVESPSPSFTQFRIKACVLGKSFSGKTACLAKITEALGVRVLSTDTLIDEGMRAFKGEKVTDNQEEKGNKQQQTSSISDLIKHEVKREYSDKLTTHAAAAVKDMRKGAVVSNELIVNILVEAISQIPAQSGWILDGFPCNITQAQMLEKALGGFTDEGNLPEFTAQPYLPQAPPPPLPVLDLALLLDIPDECVVRRAHSHGDTDAAAAAATASQRTDNTVNFKTITHRLSAFQDAWPALEKWFGGKQNILVRLNADLDEGELCSSLESVLLQVIRQKHEGHSGTGSASPVSAEGSSEANLVRPESVFSRSGSVSQLYVNEPLPPNVPEYLCSHWDNVCQSHVNNIKQVMTQLRLQLTLIDRHLFNIRERYKHYLGCPDLKQELISQWQKDFNRMPDDMREDEETKVELHQRLDELLERLWDITDKRRELDEQERAALMCDGWLEEQSTIRVNHHSMILQLEVNRFRETVHILRVYYWSMHGHLPLEPAFNDFSISLMKTAGAKDQEDAKPNSAKSTSKMTDQTQPEPLKLLQEKLVGDSEEALQAIRDMVSAEVRQRETKELNESLDEKEVAIKRSSSSAKKVKKEKQPIKKEPEDDWEKTPKTTEDSHDQGITKEMHKEYTAALKHEENSARVRLELVKSHGLMMVNSLQSRAQETFSDMEKWFQARYLSEMKCVDQLSEVVRHHIEAGAKLQYELVMKDGDFYLNGDYQLVLSVSPPPSPAPVEKPNRSILTITQLEALYCHLSNIAPSGLMSGFDLFVFLQDLISCSLGRNTLPEVWTDMNETQLLEMVSLLTDEYELIDWRRFLLSASLPWPIPSLTQLLDLLGRFRAADADDTGYINKEQYLQTESWLSKESVQSVPEESSAPLPYNCPANLRQFFFQLFADPSSSPPRLDYTSMLQYFAADPNPRLGFIRVLSVALGQHLQQPSQSLLVKSLSSLEESTELTPLKFTEEYREEEALFSSISFFKDQEVSISALLKVVCHKITKMDSINPLPPGCLSQEQHKQNLETVYSELGYKSDESVPFSIISKHPYTQMLIEASKHFQLVNILNAAGSSG